MTATSDDLELPEDDRFTASREQQRRAHRLIPGGCHTYAKGDDQYPVLAPGFISKGRGCHVWDVDGNEYIEYNMGGRAVVLGHVFEPVVEAARRMLDSGVSFTRPHIVEVDCAERFLRFQPRADMVKFTKDGSTATTAALRLARAHTGRDMVALCGDHPFFSYDDWFIGTTAMNGGIPSSITSLSTTFRYNDIASVEAAFANYPDRIAAVILEPVRNEPPRDGFLHRVRDICRQNGAVFILDEMITGFRYHERGAQELFDITPDLSTFGKAFANGFALSALCGRREIMELGGIEHDRERVFLLSTTHGAETHALAAAIAVMDVYEQEPVVEHLHRIGSQLKAQADEVIRAHGLERHIQVTGYPCNLLFSTLDAEGRPSQGYRSLFLQEMIRRGVLAPTFAVSYSHTEDDVVQTIEALDGSLGIYRRALEDGYQAHLVGRPSKVVYRSHN